MQPITDERVSTATTATTAMQPPAFSTYPSSTLTPLSTPLTTLQPLSTSPSVHYSCAVPAAFGFAFGSLAGFLINIAAGDGPTLSGAARWGVGLAACGGARCARMKARGGSEYDDPRQYYDRAIGYGIGAATVPLTGELIDRLRSRPTLAPVFVFRRSLMYSLAGALVGGAMVSAGLTPYSLQDILAA